MQNSTDNDKQEPRQSQAFDREMVEAFAFLFKGRTDCWGKISTPTGKCVYETITLQHYRRHLKGETSLGVYFNLDDSTCYSAAIDLDEKDFQKALAIRDTLMEFGLKTYIAETKHKGYRILTFFDEPQLARDVRLVLEAASSPRGGESK